MISQRPARELLYQLDRAGDQSRLAHALASIPVFATLYRGELGDEVLGLWAGLGDSYSLDHLVTAALDLWRAQGRPAADELDVLGRLVDLLTVTGSLERALELSAEVMAKAVAENSLTTRRRVLLQQGRLLHHRGRLDEAERALAASIEIANSMEERRGVADALGTLGEVWRDRGDFSRALECFQQQIALAEQMGDDQSLGSALNSLGIVHFNRGDIERALECHQRSLVIAERRGDQQRIGQTLGSLGNIHLQSGNPQKALECYQEFLAIAERSGIKQSVSRALGNMGNAYATLGEQERALQCFTRTLALAEEMSDRWSIGIALGNIGSLHFEREDPESALDYFQRQLVHAENTGNQVSVGMALGNIGIVEMERGEPHKALDALLRAIAIHRSLGFHRTLDMWLSKTGYLLLDLAEAEAAPPDWLASLLPEAADPWNGAAIARARAYGEECVAMSRAVGASARALDGEVLLCLITAAEGDSAGAVAQLTTLMEQNEIDDDWRAHLLYHLWRLDGGSHHHADSMKLYQSLNSATPRQKYRERIEELTAASP